MPLHHSVYRIIYRWYGLYIHRVHRHGIAMLAGFVAAGGTQARNKNTHQYSLAHNIFYLQNSVPQPDSLLQATADHFIRIKTAGP